MKKTFFVFAIVLLLIVMPVVSAIKTEIVVVTDPKYYVNIKVDNPETGDKIKHFFAKPDESGTVLFEVSSVGDIDVEVIVQDVNNVYVYRETFLSHSAGEKIELNYANEVSDVEGDSNSTKKDSNSTKEDSNSTEEDVEVDVAEEDSEELNEVEETEDSEIEILKADIESMKVEIEEKEEAGEDTSELTEELAELEEQLEEMEVDSEKVAGTGLGVIEKVSGSLPNWTYYAIGVILIAFVLFFIVRKGPLKSGGKSESGEFKVVGRTGGVKDEIEEAERKIKEAQEQIAKYKKREDMQEKIREQEKKLQEDKRALMELRKSAGDNY